MEALAAFGLACNVLAFVDFASKLVSDTYDFYQSASGAKRENEQLDEQAKSLQILAEQARLPNLSDNTRLSKDDEALIELGNQCREVSDKLLIVFRGLKVKGSHWRGAKSFYQALRSAWKMEEIQALQSALDRIGNRMAAQILINRQKKVMLAVEALDSQNRELSAARAEEIAALRKSIEDSFEEMKDGSRGTWDALPGIAEYGIRYAAEQRILASLRFKDMETRQATLRSAHQNTFSWIFNSSTDIKESRPSVKFVAWLNSDDSLYWVSGWPGSGKSTLMKYLWNHELVRENLKNWSRNDRLIITSYFFWTASKTELPKSQEGLLRSLLYQILRQNPDLIQRAFPAGQWDTYVSDHLSIHKPGPEFLTVPEMLEAFKRITSHLNESKTKFCFFIDALDEYEGKPNDIIRLVETLKASPNIKMCVASRSWNEFERVYGNDSSRKLYIQDLTRPDIEIYVRDTLQNNVDYQTLQETDEGTPDLVKDIVDAANGVFLWVYLVVDSLLDGLMNEDKVIDLQRRLRQLPTELKQYFRHIFDRIDDHYREQTTHVFRVALAAHDTLPLLAYWFMDKIDEDADFAINVQVEPSKAIKSAAAMRTMKKRLNARSKGLLDVQFYDTGDGDDASLSSSMLFNRKVDFLHRTVRDFLIKGDMQDMLNEWASAKFDANVVISMATLAQIKTSPQEEEYFRERGFVWKLIDICKFHAQAIGPPRTICRDRVLHELETTLRCQKEGDRRFGRFVY
jgi:hypothetical protein